MGKSTTFTEPPMFPSSSRDCAAVERPSFGDHAVAQGDVLVANRKPAVQRIGIGAVGRDDDELHEGSSAEGRKHTRPPHDASVHING